MHTVFGTYRLADGSKGSFTVSKVENLTAKGVEEVRQLVFNGSPNRKVQAVMIGLPCTYHLNPTIRTEQ